MTLYIDPIVKKNHIDETTASPSWYLLVWQYYLFLTLTIEKGLSQIPDLLYPNNPGKKGAFSFLGITNGSFLSWISPVFLALSWANTFNTCRDLYKAENRNFERWANATISAIISTTWTTLYIVGLVSVISLFTQVVPYVIAAILGLTTLFSTFNFGKYIFYALTAKDKAVRNEHLLTAVKQFISVMVNSLAFLVNLLIGIGTTTMLAHLIPDNFPNVVITIRTIGAYLAASVPFTYALSVSAILGITLATINFNKETWNILFNPSQAPKEHWALTLIKAPLRIIALAVVPLQLLFHGLKSAVNFSSPPKKPRVLTSTEIALTKETEFNTLANKLQKKLTSLKNKTPSKTILAKELFITTILTEKLGVTLDKENAIKNAAIANFKPDVSVQQIANKIKKTQSKKVFYAFFSHTSETEKCRNAVEEFQTKYYQPSN